MLQTKPTFMSLVVTSLFAVSAAFATNSIAQDSKSGAAPKAAAKAAAKSAPAAKAAAAPAGPSAAQLAAEHEAMVKAAKAEGEAVFYSTAIESSSKRVSEAFQAKYGVVAKYLRISSSPLVTRFFAEADANNLATDIVLLAGSVKAFTEEGLKKGYIEPMDKAGLPAVQSASFPKRFLTGPTAISAIYPWLIAYNSAKLKGAEIPKEWIDLLNPKYKGQILLVDPRVSEAYLDLWALLQDTHGDSFYAKLSEQNVRRYPAGVPAYQALGAGEGLVAMPAVPAGIQDLKEKGAPVDISIPTLTTGLEMHVILPARSKIKHPNAGRLLANYLLSEDGNKIFNDDKGTVAIYDTSTIPKRYSPPKAENVNRKEALTKLLGF
jgi:iron(III) transport system substrate-binding protein